MNDIASEFVEPAFEYYLVDEPKLTYESPDDGPLARAFVRLLERVLGRNKMEEHYGSCLGRSFRTDGLAPATSLIDTNEGIPMACKALRRAISTRSSLSVAVGMLSFSADITAVSHA